MLVGVRRGCTLLIAAFSPTLLAQTNAPTNPQPNPTKATPPCEKVCWTAPPECPTEADLQRLIAEQQLAAAEGTVSTALPDLGLTARVTGTASEFELVLTRLGQTRVIRSADCSALADATAMVVMLSHRDQGSWPDTLTETLPDGATSANSAPPPSDAPPTVPSTEASVSNAAQSSSAPLAAPTPVTEATAPPALQALEKPEVTTAPRSANAATPASSNDVESAEAPRPWSYEPRIAVGGLLDGWLLPVLSPGVRIAGGLNVGPWLEVQVVGHWIPAVTMPVAGTDVGVDYSYYAVGAQLCGAAPELSWFAICAALEVAALSAFAPSLRDSQRRVVVSPIPGLGAHWVPELGSFFADLGLEGWFPLRNDVFTVADHQPLHKIPTATARLSLLAGYKF